MSDATEPKAVPVEEVSATATEQPTTTEPTISEPAPPLTGANVDDAQTPAADATKDGDEEEEDEEERKSRKVTLADLCAKGTALYVKKKYEESAECYAKAAERQAELNGEMDPENAEILFLYGRSLFKVGQAKSDVLGGKAGGDKQQKKAPAEKKAAKPKEDKKGEPSGSAAVEEGKKDMKEEEKKAEVAVPSRKKPLFQFTGDENFEDSDEEEEEVRSSHFSFSQCFQVLTDWAL